MAVLPLPKVNRCCFCTRKLSVASVFIAIWSMLITSHTMAIAYRPTCETLYEKSDGPMALALTVFKWLLYIIGAVVIGSSFALIVGIFLVIQITGIVFVISGLISTVLTFVYAILYIVQLTSATCHFNPSDIMAMLMYSLCWCYFLVIVNSYTDDMVKN